MSIRRDRAAPRRADGLELAFLEMGQGFSQNSSAFHHLWLYFSLLRCCLQRLHVHYSDRGTCRSILLARATKKRNVERKHAPANPHCPRHDVPPLARRATVGPSPLHCTEHCTTLRLGWTQDPDGAKVSLRGWGFLPDGQSQEQAQD